MQDYGLDNEEINNFLNIINVDTDYPVANNANVLFCDSGDIATSQTLRIMVNGTTYYILCAAAN
jgi:hypothetical protein